MVILIPFEVQGHKVPHLNALRYGKFESRELGCGSTSSICQDALKSDNLLHKWGFVDSQMKTTEVFNIRQENFTKNIVQWDFSSYYANIVLEV